MTNEQLAVLIKNEFKYLSPITASEVAEILKRTKAALAKNNGKLSDAEVEKIVHEVLRGKTILSLSSIDMSDSSSLMKQIVDAAKRP